MATDIAREPTAMPRNGARRNGIGHESPTLRRRGRRGRADA